jgi:hypothetical protein
MENHVKKRKSEFDDGGKSSKSTRNNSIDASIGQSLFQGNNDQLMLRIRFKIEINTVFCTLR